MPNQMHQAGSKNFNFKNPVAAFGINQSEGLILPNQYCYIVVRRI